MKESGITPEIRQETIVKNIVEIKIRKGHTLSKMESMETVSSFV